MTPHNGNGSASSTRNMTNTDSYARRSEPSPQPKRGGSGFLWIAVIVVLIAMGVIFGVVYTHKETAKKQLNTSTQQMAVPTVLVVKPQRGDSEVHITLPGTVDALIESSVYAQVSGYIKDWKVDIGGQVKKDQLLAEIETPVTDQQLKQAQESVKQAQANLELAQVTAARYNDLAKTNAVSKEDVDTQNSSVKVQVANLDAALAFQGGIEKTEAFKEVKAPFDGVITARRIDVGDFVSATGQTASTGSGPSTGTPNQELFSVAQTKILRVYVNVPENYASEIVPGIGATVILASSPDHPAQGRLVRTADAIDPNSLTLLSEVDVDNPDGKLLPGGYAQVHFDIVMDHPPMVIPGNALIFRAAGPQIGIVDSDDKVRLQKITIGRDLGTKLEVTDGVKEDDQIIINPSDSLTDGQQVNVDTSQEDKKP
jgi:RND family efflux transporter MFP subunit